MTRYLFFLFIFLIPSAKGEATQTNIAQVKCVPDTIPAALLGSFEDDYGIRYSISDSLWTQHKGINYHIIKWNTAESYLIARNDIKNPGEPGLFTRIDYMTFKGMEPFLWGFCLTVYNAKDGRTAETVAAADRANPKKGCNGFPFSRMKRVQ